ncbi:flagellin [Alkalihalobacillus sp. LMS39]|uniref:flagellin N-terminal helical domain-containing protein n=1 Tax=Alkalihalobacillus sp. LMS39 TaxID=2924032 RepID=UPI001FB52547|nr:flagellin [Alkalihalobacillus sp. LMS39]UOE95970.1 flagellin [Alkalihalobacillus sp. LMS39]
MKINNNIQALNAYRNLNQNQVQTSKNLEKLSSGLRINRAADDAAGLAISEKMRSQIRGLKMAERNAMDGISLLQTAEGALTEVHAMLQRMRELAVQGANDSNTDYDREQIQKEIDQLKKEIDSISQKTEFNTRKLLDGTSAVISHLQVNEANVATGFPNVQNAEFPSGDYLLNVTQAQLNSTLNQPGAGFTADAVAFTDGTQSKLGQYTFVVSNVTTVDDVRSAKIEVFDPDGFSLGTKTTDLAENTEVVIGGVRIDTENLTEGTAKISLEANVQVQLSRVSDGTPDAISTTANITTTKGRIIHEGIEYQFGSNVSTGNVEFSITNNSLSFQIGANTNQNVMIDIPAMDSQKLGVDKVKVTTLSSANDAIYQLDQAINAVSDARAKLGAIQNRMEHTINNLQVTHENLTAAESRIRDADMALEMTIFTRNNILNQSATAMLAQANQLPQGVLQLLQ